MRFAVAADHAGFSLKQPIEDELRRLGHLALDLGGDGTDPDDDYPDYAVAVGRALVRGDADRGILVCGSAVGACVAANKLPGIRAGLCHDTYSAHQSVEHDDCNVLALGARVIGPALALELVRAFAGARFDGGERYRRRLAKVVALEEEGARKRAPAGRKQ